MVTEADAAQAALAAAATADIAVSRGRLCTNAGAER